MLKGTISRTSEADDVNPNSVSEVPRGYLAILFALAALTSSCQGYTPTGVDFSITSLPPAETPIAPADLPDGQFACQGYENGLIASIGSVTFASDGNFIDQAFYGPSGPGNNGTWSYKPDSGRLTFSDNLDFAFGVFDGAQDTVTLDLRDGVTRAHADSGQINCFRK